MDARRAAGPPQGRPALTIEIEPASAGRRPLPLRNRLAGTRLGLVALTVACSLLAFVVTSYRVIHDRVDEYGTVLCATSASLVADLLEHQFAEDLDRALAGMFRLRDVRYVQVFGADGVSLRTMGEAPTTGGGAGATGANSATGPDVTGGAPVPRLSPRGLMRFSAPLRSSREELLGRIEIGLYPERALRALWRGTAGLLLFGLLVLCAVVLLARLESRELHRPLLELAHAARGMSAGEPASVPDPPSAELAPLHDAVAALGRRLEEARELVEVQRKVLGDAVTARTRELQKKNLALSIQNERIREVSRLKSGFLASVSHELRTPLHAILALSEILRDGVTGELASDEQRKQVELIHQSGKALLTLINDMLDLARVEAGHVTLQLAQTDVAALVRRVMEELGPLASEKGLEVSADVPPLEAVWLDPGRVGQVLTNLLSNAIKFTEQGRIEITARYDETASRLELAVSDTGPGIAPQDHETIFLEFRQLDNTASRRYGGTGLGLAISRKLVRCMKGDLRVESDLGHGSTFTFWVEAPRGKPSKTVFAPEFPDEEGFMPGEPQAPQPGGAPALEGEDDLQARVEDEWAMLETRLAQIRRSPESNVQLLVEDIRELVDHLECIVEPGAPVDDRDAVA